MRNIVLSTSARFLLPLLLVFSIFVLLRGHNDPGGGFVGGLIAAAAFSLHALAFDVNQTLRALRISPRVLIGVGMGIAIASSIFPLLTDHAFMYGLRASFYLPAIGKPSVAFFFDCGVYLVVLGVVLTIVFTFFDDEEF